MLDESRASPGVANPEPAVAQAEPEADVVLVDDDPVTAAMVKRALAKQGYRLSWFVDGVAAVGALCQPATGVSPKLILLDVSMPGLGGFGVLHYLRRDGVLDQSSVIMLTASASEDDVRRAIGLGAIGYLTKPLDPRRLIDRVRRALAPAGEPVAHIPAAPPDAAAPE